MSAAAALTPLTLGAVLLSLVLVIAPHAAHLPTWIPVIAGTIILLRFYLGVRRKPLPNRWLLLAAAAICVAGVALSYRTVYGRDVGVALLTVMVALKLMEMTAARDTVVVVLLAYFLVVTNFFYSQTIPTALYMLLVVWIITASMIALQHRVSPPRPAHVLRKSGALILQSIPVMVVLFLLFPRIQGPLWGLPQVNIAAKSGLSDTMSPGDVSVLSLSDDIAFRVLFETPVENPARLYWRGPVLNDFDGQTWHAGLSLTVGQLRFEPLSEPIRYSVTLEPHDRRWLFAIDLPTAAPRDGFLTNDFQMRSRRLVRERLRYDMESVPVYRVGLDERQVQLNSALRLPANSVSPRARALAQSWREDGSTPREILGKALAMYRQQPFIYTLAPPALGDDPVDEFLFTTRSGFCEHYASSFTFLMRAAGIPARVVTGYLGGEVNPVDGYVVVRQSEAHAWTEVWLEGEGWVRVDPTAAVSPLRVESGLAAAVPAADRSALASERFDWIKQMRFAWDAVANSWNQWVLGYNPERQSRFLQQIGLEQASWQNMVIVMMVGSTAIVLVLAATLLLRLVRRRHDPVQRLYELWCEAMARRGAARRPSEGPRDFAARVSLQVPELRERAQQVSALYIALRYGRGGSPDMLRELRMAVRRA